MLADPQTPEQIRSKLRIVKRNLDLQQQIIQDLRDTTSLQCGKAVLNLGPMHVHAALDEAIETCWAGLQHTELKITRSYAAPMDLIIADERRLLQVFWNLVQNAFKYTPPGGKVEIRTRLASESTKSEPRMIIEFADSGIGADPAQLQEMFDPFAQESSGKGGLGLGLYIASKIVQFHSGRVLAFSEGKGRGATFSVVLPMCRPIDDRSPVRLAQ
jgi:signal transduction histidine kinase